MGVVGGVVVQDVLILGGARVVTVGGASVVVVVVILIIAVQFIAALIVRTAKLSCNNIRDLTFNIFILVRGHLILDIPVPQVLHWMWLTQAMSSHMSR